MASPLSVILNLTIELNVILPWYQRFFFLVGGEAAKTSREAASKKKPLRSLADQHYSL